MGEKLAAHEGSEKTALEARIAALEKQVEKLADAHVHHRKGNAARRETVQIMGRQIDRHTEKLFNLEDEVERVWMHLTPILEKAFPGISKDLLKTVRFHKKDDPDPTLSNGS